MYNNVKDTRYDDMQSRKLTYVQNIRDMTIQMDRLYLINTNMKEKLGISQRRIPAASNWKYP
jgi:hypothetical protein